MIKQLKQNQFGAKKNVSKRFYCSTKKGKLTFSIVEYDPNGKHLKKTSENRTNDTC